ncbi:hypothetical protein J437_LFUL013482 [Ladona fulva]|uniref:RanBD1 domain-containing protein n=1 Tax=Ladona fulva TaxID=123851 RepID=A0A8K0P4F5_LADFU|nr:hypothetical protein J437_LFUL013482 [Ladona fulva]
MVAVPSAFAEGKLEAASTNGDSEMLFSSDGGQSKSLSEAAREYEEARAVKRKYEEVTIITGEEDEENVLQITCKLFAFNIEKSSWVERGRGQLRVNDKNDQRRKQSRLIWAGMSVVRASPKSIRLTAMDDNQIRVFLIMASPADTDRLLQILLTRVELQQQLEDEEASSPSKKLCNDRASCSGEEDDRGVHSAADNESSNKAVSIQMVLQFY